jgi:ATP/maltotriose-dependent transcriptional regulator MalT
LAVILSQEAPTGLLTELTNSQFPLIRRLENDRYELHSFFKDFLREKLIAVESADAIQRLHKQFAARYEAIGDWQEAIHHASQIEDWHTVTRLLSADDGHRLAESAQFVKNTLEHFPPEQFLA